MRQISQGRRWLKSSTERNALPLDAQILPRKEEFVEGMGQRENDAAVKDAQIKLRKEEYAIGMEQSAKYAAVKDVQIK